MRQVGLRTAYERPPWLTLFAILSLSVGALCFLVILLDILVRHRQPMMIMNVVW